MNGKQPRQKPVVHEGYLINDAIRAKEIRVIAQNGENLGLLSRKAALDRAVEAGLDLVVISKEGEDQVIAKIMDFGKFLFERKKKQQESKKHQKVIQIKEIKMRPNIGPQDYQTKLRQAVSFLKDGKKVKFTLQFRGREVVMMNDVGPSFFARIRKDLEVENLGTILEEKETNTRPLWSKIMYLK